MGPHTRQVSHTALRTYACTRGSFQLAGNLVDKTRLPSGLGGGGGGAGRAGGKRFGMGWDGFLSQPWLCNNLGPSTYL